MQYALCTNKGNINFHVFTQEVPLTSQHFISLVESGFYNGLLFFKYVPGILVQTGCPFNNGLGGLGYHIKSEHISPGIRHGYGSLSMARTSPEGNGSQFFICLEDDYVYNFDRSHTCFGKVDDRSLAILKKLRKNDTLFEIKVPSTVSL